VLGERALRRALTLAVDRERAAAAVYGPAARVPAGPMSELLWIGREGISTLPFDTAAAARLLDSAGWRRASPGATRRRDGVPLRFDVMVPATSPPRRQLAVILQEAWRPLGVEATVTAVDFAVFQERLMDGRFDAYIGAYLDEPSPRGLGDQWGRAGWDALNYGKWSSAAFDSLLAAAGATSDMERARRLYREAIDTIGADAPAIFLYTPVQSAAVHRRLEGVEIDPYSWLSGLPGWRITGRR
jgi:peptide/nickel transport system substrate-binding protein